MSNAASEDPIAFDLETKAAFIHYLNANPNNRRVSRMDEATLIDWITDPNKRPFSQKEFSRRNYVRKTFFWDEENRNLLAVAKVVEGNRRLVVTEDLIADIVEFVHKGNGHLGWDATWRDVSSSYYGILRSDVIFLLKRCQICAKNPSKRAKSTIPGSEVENDTCDDIESNQVVQ